MTRVWRPGREDLLPALFILLLPIVAALPRLLGLLIADPALLWGDMRLAFVDGPLPGAPYADPNAGYTTHALGYRAALDWISGAVPWWNPYSGVGLPLAAEYQPAAFFPLTLLLLAPHGMTLQHVALQVLAGAGTYGLLRQMGLGRLAATTGACLYAFNGTLAWFAHGPAQAVPFLPWMLWGIERALAHSRSGAPGGWRMLAAAMALSLLAGFPETAYINGLLALAWTLQRGIALPATARVGMAARIAAGGVTGIAIAAPQVMSFFQYLSEAFIGGHADFSLAALGALTAVQSLIAPYAYGPIVSYAPVWPELWGMWGSIGGYVTLAIVLLALYGFLCRRSPLHWLLLAWIVITLLKTFRLEPGLTLWNLVPGVSIAAFARYAQPSWELALIVLAMAGLDDIARTRTPRHGALAGAAAIVVAATAGGLWLVGLRWPVIAQAAELRLWAVGSATWAMASALACLSLVAAARWRGSAATLAALLACEGVVMFSIPTLSNPLKGSVDRPAIEFLQTNLGLQRFYTLGPIQPNYGAYYGIASINHNYLPTSARWVTWVQSNLDRAADGAVFNGNYGRAAGAPSQAEELRRNLAAYEWAGVKYVVARAGDDPFGVSPKPRIAYSDTIMTIYQLPDPKPYFEAIAGRCVIDARTRTHATLGCDAPATIVRRELFHSGWTAVVDGREVPIAEHRNLFQAISVPAGAREVEFRYSPPGIGWAWLAAAIGGFVFLSAPLLGRARRGPHAQAPTASR